MLEEWRKGGREKWTENRGEERERNSRVESLLLRSFVLLVFVEVVSKRENSLLISLMKTKQTAHGISPATEQQ
jgi:hypothetical protein